MGWLLPLLSTFKAPLGLNFLFSVGFKINSMINSFSGWVNQHFFIITTNKIQVNYA